MSDALPKPVLFLAYANDRIDPVRYLPKIVEEVHFIRDLLEDQARKDYEIVVRDQASIDDLFAVFDRYGPRIHLFHFAGHADSLRLLLDQSTDARSEAGIAGFTRELAALSGLQFVFLNACATRDHAIAMAEAGIPAVVATSMAIGDEAAYLFAKRFYEQLVRRKSINECFQVAERRVQSQLMGSAEDYRSLYWDDEPHDHFPWGMHGEGVQWRLMLSQRIAQPDKTPLMVNRYRQVISFRDKAEEILADSDHFPYTFLIHGTRAERHDSLITRLIETDIRSLSNQLFGSKRGVVHERTVRNWPYQGSLEQRQRELKRRLAEAMSFVGRGPTDSWGAPQLIDTLGLRARTVVLQHTISSEKWDATTRKLIQWYVGEFWQIPALPERPQFILFISLLYPEDEVTWWERLFGGASPRQQIKESLYQLEADVPGSLTVLEELKPVPFEDVVSWVDEYYPRTLGELPEVLYDGNQDRRLSMDVVEPELRRAIRSLGSSQGEREMTS